MAPEGIHTRPSALKSRVSRKAHHPGQAGESPDPLCAEDKALGFPAWGKGETGDGHLMPLVGRPYPAGHMALTREGKGTTEQCFLPT